MKKSVVFTIAAALCGLASGVRAGDQKPKSAADTLTVQLDVAMDASSLRATRPDFTIVAPLRGDTFISNGIAYAGGTIPDGDTTNTFPLTDDGRIGTLVSRGQYIADGVDIASGAAAHSVATTHDFMLDEGSGVITEGLEGNGTEVRAVVGGYGKYSGATGQVTEEVLGSNDSGGPNLRFTFTLTVTNAQPASEAMPRKGYYRRH